MVDYQIPITYFVSAQAVTPSAGLEPLKLGTILLLTDEVPANDITGSYMIARSASSVANQWGTGTETAAQATAIFSQSPNILNNDGYLIVAPYQDIVTAGTVTTVDLSEKLTALEAVTDGELTVTVDGTAQELKEINLSSASSLEDIADLIGAKLTGATVSVSNNELVFTSNTTGTASSVTLSATADATTDLYGADYLDGAQATTAAGTETEETLTQAIQRMAGILYFNGIITTRAVEDDEYIAASAAVQAMQDRILICPASTTNALTNGTGLFTKTASNFYTRNLLYTLGDNDSEAAYNARIFAAAYLSRGLATNYSGSNTAITMNLKDLVGIEADTNISETILERCATVGADCFPSVEGLAKVVSNEQGGMYFDQVTNQIWLVTTIQREVFNVLATTRTKIPQTEAGANIIMSAIKDVCVQGVTNGYLAPGEWNSSDTFGNQEDFLRNIREFGYYIWHQPVSEQSQSQREQRKCVPFMVACKESGAVHSCNIQIYLEA